MLVFGIDLMTYMGLISAFFVVYVSTSGRGGHSWLPGGCTAVGISATGSTSSSAASYCSWHV